MHYSKAQESTGQINHAAQALNRTSDAITITSDINASAVISKALWSRRRTAMYLQSAASQEPSWPTAVSA